MLLAGDSGVGEDFLDKKRFFGRNQERR